MKYRLQTIAMLFLAVAVTSWTVGCSMCCDTYDYHYPTFGGKHQRADPVYGRVGSIFSDPGANPGGPGPDSNLKQVEDKSRRDLPDIPEPGMDDPLFENQNLPNPSTEPNVTPGPDDNASLQLPNPRSRSRQTWR